MDKDLIIKTRKFAKEMHDKAGCTYGNEKQSYVLHLDMVYDIVNSFEMIFNRPKDAFDVKLSAFCHDLIEDAQLTYNDIRNLTNKEVADIVLAVTDVHAENRMLRFLNTIPKTIKDHRSLVLKICDIAANSGYGNESKNSMFRKYQKEWEYKKHIFHTTSRWYKEELDLEVFDRLMGKVNEILEK